MQDDDYGKIRDNYRENYDQLVQVEPEAPIPATSSTSTRTSSRSREAVSRGSRPRGDSGRVPSDGYRQHLVDRALEGNCLRHEVDVVELAHEVGGVVERASRPRAR